MDHCFFEDLYNCKSTGKGKKKNCQQKLQINGIDRIENIIAASKDYGDDFHIQLEELKETTAKPTIKSHKNCASRYCSITNVNWLKRKKTECESSESAPKKRSRTSNVFDFRKHCLFCPDVSICTLIEEYDPKVPHVRRRKAYLVRTDKNASGADFKQYILNICDLRNDSLGETVPNRVLSTVGDLHAADARYHNDCKINFTNSKYQNRSENSKSLPDVAFNSVVDTMLDDRTKIWNSIDLVDE